MAPSVAESEATVSIGTVTISSERVRLIINLTPVDAVAQLNDHVRALRAGRRRVAPGGELLGDDRCIALEFEAAIAGHSVTGHDDEGLPLRRRHGLVARDIGFESGLAAGKADGCHGERERCGKLDHTHGYSP